MPPTRKALSELCLQMIIIRPLKAAIEHEAHSFIITYSPSGSLYWARQAFSAYTWCVPGKDHSTGGYTKLARQTRTSASVGQGVRNDSG